MTPPNCKRKIHRVEAPVKEPRKLDQELLFLASNGVILIPCRPGSKEPIGRWRHYRDCYSFEDVLNKASPDCNWAIYCGDPKNRLVVLDCDDEKSSIEFLKLFGDIPFPYHWTRRGLHAIFVWPDHIPLPACSRIAISSELLPKAELLIDHLALIPPSVVEGRRYQWDSSPLDFWPPAPVPDKLLEALGFNGPLHNATKEGQPAELPGPVLTEEQKARPGEERGVTNPNVGGEEGKVVGVCCSCLPTDEPTKNATNDNKRRFSKTLSFSLASNLNLARLVMQKLDSDLPGLYVPCHCPLHKPDRSPSSVWLRSPAGLLLFHDFHDGASFTIAELYAFAKTGRIQKLKIGEQRKWLMELAKETGALAEEMRAMQAEHERALDLIGNERLRQWWRILWMFAAGEMTKGTASFLAPVRRIGELMGLGYKDACRAINLLCVLGFFVKAGYSERGGAQRLEACRVEPMEALARWEKLQFKRLSQIRKSYVRAKLGHELAEAVFRREKGKDDPVTGTFESSQTPQGEDLASLSKGEER